MPASQLIYLAYGRDTALLECRYSVLSALALAREPLRVVVCTDRPGDFDGWPVETIALSPQTLAEWQGPGAFVFRSKIRLLQTLVDAADRTLLADADTLFVRPPDDAFERLTPGHALMHRDEGAIFTGRRHRGLASYLLGLFPARRVGLPGGRAFAIPPGAHFWNAGVLGLHRADAALLGRALELSDAIHAASQWFLSEQFAFSLLLAGETTLTPAEGVIEHYWSTVSYPGWRGGRSERHQQHDAARRFFAAHAAGGFGAMRDAYRRAPGRVPHVSTARRALAAGLRRLGVKTPTPM